MFLDVNPSVLGPASSEFKRCAGCGDYKPRDQFHRWKAARDGLKSRCKSCISEYAKANKEHKAAYDKVWRATNRERITANCKAWYLSNKEKKAAYDKVWRIAYYEANKERIAEYGRAYRKANKTRISEWGKEWSKANKERRAKQGKIWNAANKERKAITNKAWREANPDKSRAGNHRRRARLRGAGGLYSAADIEAIRAAQTDKKGRLICWRCGEPIKGTPHLDHWIPLAGGGTNDAGNLHYMHAHCNLTKSSKHPTEIGRLL